MPGTPFLSGKRLDLCPVEPDDHPFLARHWNDPAVRHGTNRYDPLTESDVADVCTADDAVHFLACRDGDPVGLTWLFRIEDVNRRGDLGYWIATDEAGQGYATEAARLCLRHAFDERNLRKVVARVFEDNVASMRVLEKLGFREAGRLREHYYVDGRYVDAILYEALCSEFQRE
ncbi:GNAT family protein [Natrinema sp. 1APR25-10V2]|uniref:GNAT family N-acetyltransferase n=1 Tax=Natrinema sp. 1APR25-10V2 TaxID=2951081 RepID=UPI002875239E|nr:GNAT family protein [Natrinema sp. 1APR25-10V2]MDS0478488.1 GNAT family N-acetyltransferase [Natrinema sp. 1APR25-10V2]